MCSWTPKISWTTRTTGNGPPVGRHRPVGGDRPVLDGDLHLAGLQSVVSVVIVCAETGWTARANPAASEVTANSLRVTSTFGSRLLAVAWPLVASSWLPERVRRISTIPSVCDRGGTSKGKGPKSPGDGKVSRLGASLALPVGAGPTFADSCRPSAGRAVHAWVAHTLRQRG